MLWTNPKGCKLSMCAKMKNKTVNGSWKVDFQPVGLRGRCPRDLSLLDCARHLGVDLVNLCGGAGKCGRCIVRIVEGRVSPPSETEKKSLLPEQIRKGYRLACETIPQSDIKVGVPPESLTTPQRTQVESIQSSVAAEPLITMYEMQLHPPGSKNFHSDCRRLMDALRETHGIDGITISPEVLRALPIYLRDNAWKVRVAMRQKEIIGLADEKSGPLGFAVDIGTTKIALYLVDLISGRTLASKGEMNPQINYGEDIIARFVYAQSSVEHAVEIQKILVETLNQMMADLCRAAGVSPTEVFDVVIVCNTAIHHLLLRLPTEPLSQAPYIPVIDSEMDVKASSLGLKTAPGAYVHLLPNIAGYVGSDHVAMLLAIDIFQRKGICLALDIGTNTEICLSNRGRLSSLSCASGPAFEGAHIKFGMRAGDGAIERLKIDNNVIRYQTIGGKIARGVCGSGILDVLAEMVKVGALDKSGRMKVDHPLVRNNNGLMEMVLTIKDPEVLESKDITFSQKDVRQIQLAVGAIKTGIKVLLKTHRLQADQIDQIIIAGAFGTYINISSAKVVGMVPDIPEERFVQVGNAAGLGSRLALISKSKREEAVKIADQVEYVELAAFPDFSKMFVEAMHLA